VFSVAIRLDNIIAQNSSILLLTPTIVACVKRSSASVCECVCPHHRTKTAENTITKLATGIVYHESWLLMSKGQRSRSQGHKVQKHISGARVPGVNLNSIECPPSIII